MTSRGAWSNPSNTRMSYDEAAHDPDLKEQWTQAAEQEFGRMFQGFEGVEGQNILSWLAFPEGETIAYQKVIVPLQPKMEAATGANIPEPDEAITFASLETVKIHWLAVALLHS